MRSVVQWERSKTSKVYHFPFFSNWTHIFCFHCVILPFELYVFPEFIYEIPKLKYEGKVHGWFRILLAGYGRQPFPFHALCMNVIKGTPSKATKALHTGQGAMATAILKIGVTQKHMSYEFMSGNVLGDSCLPSNNKFTGGLVIPASDVLGTPAINPDSYRCKALVSLVHQGNLVRLQIHLIGDLVFSYFWRLLLGSRALVVNSKE